MINKIGRIQEKDTIAVFSSVKVNCVRLGVPKDKEVLGGPVRPSLLVRAWATIAAADSQSLVSVNKAWNEPTPYCGLAEENFTKYAIFTRFIPKPIPTSSVISKM